MKNYKKEDLREEKEKKETGTKEKTIRVRSIITFLASFLNDFTVMNVGNSVFRYNFLKKVISILLQIY